MAKLKEGEVNMLRLEETESIAYVGPTVKPKMTLDLVRQRARVALTGLRVKAGMKVMGRNAQVMISELRLRKWDHKKGVWVDYGLVSRKVITDTGVAFLVDDWDTDAQDITTMNFHGYGTGSQAEAAANTALQTEVETPRGAGTKSQPTAPQLRSVQTHTFSGTFGIKEHGLFSASTVGTMWDRSMFAVINVVANDAIEATYTCTVSSGG